LLEETNDFGINLDIEDKATNALYLKTLEGKCTRGRRRRRKRRRRGDCVLLRAALPFGD
jgi:hypothetical protein